MTPVPRRPLQPVGDDVPGVVSYLQRRNVTEVHVFRTRVVQWGIEVMQRGDRAQRSRRAASRTVKSEWVGRALRSNNLRGARRYTCDHAVTQ